MKPVATTDQMFLRFSLGLFVVMIVYAAIMACVLIWGDSSTASKMLSSFGAMFAGILGLGSGYLLGRTGHPPEPVADSAP